MYLNTAVREQENKEWGLHQWAHTHLQLCLQLKHKYSVCTVTIYISSVHLYSYYLCRGAHKEKIKDTRKDLFTLGSVDYWLVHSVPDGDSAIAWNVPCRFLNWRLQNQFCGNWLDVTSLQTHHGCQEAKSSSAITVFKYQGQGKAPGWASHRTEQRLTILTCFHLQGDKQVYSMSWLVVQNYAEADSLQGKLWAPGVWTVPAASAGWDWLGWRCPIPPLSERRTRPGGCAKGSPTLCQLTWVCPERGRIEDMSSFQAWKELVPGGQRLLPQWWPGEPHMGTPLQTNFPLLWVVK